MNSLCSLSLLFPTEISSPATMTLTGVGCLIAGLSEEAVAVYGKAVRGTRYARGDGQPVHLVAALDRRAGAVLARPQ
jgi:hypothetical protein